MKKPDTKPQDSQGVLSNLRFVLNLMWGFQKSAIVYMALIAVFSSVFPLFGIVFPKLIIDELTGLGRTEYIVRMLGIGFGLVFVSKTIATIATNSFSQITLWFKVLILSGEKYMSMDYALTDDPAMSDLNERAERVLKRADEGILGILNKMFDICAIMLTFVFSLLIVSSLNVGVVVLFMGICLLNYFVEMRFNKSNIALEDRYPTFTRKLRYLSDWMQEYQFGKDLRLYNLQNLLYQKYQSNADNVKGLDGKRAAMTIQKGIVFGGIALVNEIALYTYLIYRFLSGGLSIGDFTMYVIAIRTFCSVFNELITAFARIIYLSSGIGIVRRFLDFTSGPASALQATPDKAPFNIEFVNVCFKYPHQDDYVLKNINLNIDSRQKLALVGMNGAGKTTFIKLMMGLYLPTSGEIRINGISTALFDRKSLYRLFSVVFQDVELFAMTLAENISMCPYDETDMNKAAFCIETVGLTDMLISQPSKLDTMVTKNIYEGGVDFSGGQKQRIAIARALYKDRPILILDEPTAALDAFAENEIYQIFSKMTRDKTCVFISHRLSSVAFCDKVMLLDNGEICEYGTHDELMQNQGKYYELFTLQAKYYKGGDEK